MEWDEGDLVDRLCRAIDISRKSLALFSERGYSETESVENNFRPDKPIAEASMLLYAASAVSHHRKVADRVEDVARLIAPLARSKRIMLSMLLCPSLSVEFAVPHVLLSKLGYTDPQFDEFLALCLSSQASRGHERPPFASLERCWILELWSGVDAGDDWQIDAAQSVLNWPIDLIGGLKEDAYALTHLVVYSTDFGNRLKPLPRDSSIILAKARSFLARCLDEEDYDLAAEMLMIWPELCAPWCASSSFAFRVLITIEDQVGVLPSVRTKSDRLASLEGEARTGYAVATAYHTALVMGLLCAVALRDGRKPPTHLSGDAVSIDVIDELLTFIDTDRGHWQPVLLSLPDDERRTLAPSQFLTVFWRPIGAQFCC
jgi:hypothetical protein